VSSWTAMTDESAFLYSRLQETGVTLLPSRILLAQEERQLRFSCAVSGQVSEVPCLTLILVTGRMPNDRLYTELARAKAGFALHRIGDCLQPSSIADAVYSAHRFARGLGGDVPDVPRRERPQWRTS
jgi:dimethylamine/trimethylamine dehydrogenase